MTFLVWIISAIFLGLIPAAIAKHKGRGFTSWWVYGFLIFIVALPHSIIIRSEKDTTEGGVASRLCLALMAVWTVICLLGLLSGLAAVSEIQPANEFEEAGAGIGMAIGIGFWGMLWFFPAVVLGIIALVTKPKGEKIQLFTQAVLCPHCGKYTSGSAKYCSNCGREMANYGHGQTPENNGGVFRSSPERN